MNQQTHPMMSASVRAVFDQLLQRYPVLKECEPSIAQSFAVLRQLYSADHQLLICGNGGSAADAEHIVGELMKGFMRSRPVSQEARAALVEQYPSDGAYLADHLQGALRAVALTGHTPLSTAFANDVAADMLFAQQVWGYGRAGDGLLALSTSGNARNVLHAVKVARARGLTVLGLTGHSGGKLAPLCDVCICVPEQETYRVQELHLPVYHALCAMLEAEFFA